MAQTKKIGMKRFAVETARKAGAYLRQNFHQQRLLNQRATAKGLTTKFDRQSDRLITSEIKRQYPEHSILTEESGLLQKKSEYIWIIDPLDGSTNFVRGNPFFAVSIALQKAGELILGVIYAPLLDELYIAEKNKGASCNGRKLAVSSIALLQDAYLLSCEGGEKTNRKIAAINARLHPIAKDLRKLGSAALEAASVAAGKSDVYLSLRIAPWDVAAGILLVEEAGGKVTDFTGDPWSGKTANLVFSNKILHTRVLLRLK